MADAIDTALKIGASFDWISPLASVLGDVMNGPSHTFLITHNGCPMSGREINIMLNRRGIKNWGHMIVAGTLMVNVCEDNARQAEGALKNHGVPIENSLPAAGKTPAPSRKPAPQLVAQQAQADVRWWQCTHCENWYRKWKTTCPSCGAPLQPWK